MTVCGRQFENPGPRTVAEHLSCSLMLLRFLPMRSGSQQCVDVVQRVPTFTAVTRVRIPSGSAGKSAPSLVSPPQDMGRTWMHLSLSMANGLSVHRFPAFRYHV
jgi:hypothetical protein